MNCNLRGKTALITGAERGLGKCVAFRLAADGADVVLQYLFDRERAEEAAKQIRGMGRKAFVVRADFNDVAEIEALIREVREKAGTVDILINNAGAVFERMNFMDAEKNRDEAWERSFRVNFLSCVRLMRAFLPGMCEKGWGRVINVSSVTTRIRASHGSTVHYSPMKAALETLSEHVSSETAPYGVTVNCVAPGNMETQLLKDSPLPNPDIHSLYHVRRSADPEEVAAVIEFLASQEASFVTGETVFAAGGR